MSFDSGTLIITLSIVFALVAVVTSAVYYFARYYFKTDNQDRELFTSKPIDIVASEPNTKLKTIGEALEATKKSLFGRISGIQFSSGLDAKVREQVEDVLYTSDLGPTTAELLLETIEKKLSGDEKRDAACVADSLREEMFQILSRTKRSVTLIDELKVVAKPKVWMIVGINGAGKTTTIGKLASLAQLAGHKTIVAAGDTFRAAADAQLRVWAERSGCEIFSPDNVKDPSAVAFSAIERTRSQNADLCIIDTAGRLHTQVHLMAELQKMVRVIQKVLPEAPHEKLLVTDANAGQNALAQAREFHQAIGLTGVIITKLDGSSKAGVAIGIANELKIPICYIGVGEALDDLRVFQPKTFVEAII